MNPGKGRKEEGLDKEKAKNKELGKQKSRQNKYNQESLFEKTNKHRSKFVKEAQMRRYKPEIQMRQYKKENIYSTVLFLETILSKSTQEQVIK